MPLLFQGLKNERPDLAASRGPVAGGMRQTRIKPHPTWQQFETTFTSRGLLQRDIGTKL